MSREVRFSRLGSEEVGKFVDFEGYEYKRKIVKKCVCGVFSESSRIYFVKFDFVEFIYFGGSFE